MKSTSVLLLFSIVLMMGLMVAFPVFAQGGAGGNENGDGGGGTGDDYISLTNPAGESTTVSELVHRITSALVTIATPIVAIMVLIGAFQILFAAGDPEKFKRGKKTILYTVIGYAIILVASGITSIIKSVLTTAGN